MTWTVFAHRVRCLPASRSGKLDTELRRCDSHRSSGRFHVANVGITGNLDAVKTALRVFLGVFVAAAIGVALVPLLVVLDIRRGGDGWGLCTDGLSGCETTYFAGFEFIALFLVVLFSILTLAAMCIRLLRWIDARTGPPDPDSWPGP